MKLKQIVIYLIILIIKKGEKMILPVEVIRGRSIPDVWFQAVDAILTKGFKYTIQRGSNVDQQRLSFHQITLVIEMAYRFPYDLMLPDLPQSMVSAGIPAPVEPGYVEQYMPYLLTDYIEPGELYTYGSRIFKQISFWIEVLKKTPNTEQAILQVGKPSDENLEHPPCLRHIDMRVLDGYLIFYPYFRSWDLWNGLPANLAGIAVLQKSMADEIGLKVGPICATSKGLHLYDYVEELARIRCNK